MDIERKFQSVDQNDDGVIDLSEWNQTRIFVSAEASEKSVGTKFTSYDTNNDGHLHFMELYTNIRANQIRWTNFERLWEEIDPTSDLWSFYSEAVEGFQRVHPDLTQAQIEALFNAYDMNADGKIWKLDMWV